MKTFNEKVVWAMERLMHATGWNATQAAGAIGNLAHECAGFTKLHEVGQPEGRGGYGWAQWTGPRRQAFLRWCDHQKLDWRSDAANMGFLLKELREDYRGVAERIGRCKTLEQAVIAFEREYERAGVVHMESRLAWAKKALAAWEKRGAV